MKIFKYFRSGKKNRSKGINKFTSIPFVNQSYKNRIFLQQTAQIVVWKSKKMFTYKFWCIETGVEGRVPCCALRESWNTQLCIYCKSLSTEGNCCFVEMKNPCFRIATGIIRRVIGPNSDTIYKKKYYFIRNGIPHL